MKTPIPAALLLVVILIIAIVLGIAIGSVQIPPRTIVGLILDRLSIIDFTASAFRVICSRIKPNKEVKTIPGSIFFSSIASTIIKKDFFN